MWFIIGITQPISIFVIRFFLLIPFMYHSRYLHTHLLHILCYSMAYMVSLRSIGIETAAIRQLNAVFIMITIINSNSICGRIWGYTHKFVFGFGSFYDVNGDCRCLLLPFTLRTKSKLCNLLIMLCNGSNRNKNLDGENHEKYAEFLVEIYHH